MTPKIIDNPVTDELSQSFLEYSLSVIVARALPDVRDGLKPVHRKILYALHSLGIRPNSPYKKCARVVGETMGRYHPHGDSAIYEALVRLAQPWATYLPVVDGHGNFGSLDDGPAAARYTECRMSVGGAAMLEALEENTVDFGPNYDGTENEPLVLPSAFPNLIVNGGSGIAVGMASVLPPHNLAEVVAGLCAMLDNPKITLDELMKHIPGPDFPTGGQVLALGGVYDAYKTGRGSFRIRATARIIDVTARKRGVEITELPYQVGPEKVIAQIKELVTAKRITSIADVKDLSDRKVGLRLIVECKTGFNPEAVLAELYRLTHLDISFNTNAVVLVDGQPATLSLLDMCQHYLGHRRDVIRRRTEYRRAKAEARRHIVEGILIALGSIDEVVAVLKSSRDTDTARKRLTKTFKLSDIQATNILEMPLRRLVNLEVTKLKDELREITATLRDLNKILTSPKVLTELIKSELINVSDAFATPRRSRLSDEVPVLATELTTPDEPCLVGLSAGSIGRLVPASPRAKLGATDLFHSILPTSTHTGVGLVTSMGRLHRIDTMTLMETSLKSLGVSLGEYVALDPGETAVAVVTLPLASPLAMATSHGVLKRLDPKTVPTRFPAEIIALEDGDAVVGAVLAPDDASLVLVTSEAQLLRTPAKPIRPQGRSAAGVVGVKLTGARVIMLSRAHEGDVLVLATDGGIKVTPVTDYPEKGRGGIGVRCAKLRTSESAVTYALVAPPNDILVVAGKSTLELPPSSRRDASTTPTETVTGLGLARPRAVQT